MATHPYATIRYYASDMVLNIHSDALYITASKSHCQTGGHYFLGLTPHPDSPTQLNGVIRSLSTILHIVVTSTAEAELEVLFLNAKQAKIIRLVLLKFGDPIATNANNW